MIGIPHRVTVYVDRVCDAPPGSTLRIVNALHGAHAPLLELHPGDRYVQRVRWWRCGSWRSRKRREIDVKRSRR